MKCVAVYCGSASPPDARYMDLARDVGTTLAGMGIAVVYGGGRRGLMGALADAALSAGGEVTGVIPDRLVNDEIAHRGCTRLHVVGSMHERKAMFTDLADGFLTLPGGVGTMDELWEAVSWAQLGYHAKPIGLLNAFGYFDQLLAFARHMAATGFVRAAHADLILHDEALLPLLDRMANHRPTRPIFAMKAEEL